MTSQKRLELFGPHHFSPLLRRVRGYRPGKILELKMLVDEF